MRVLQVVPTSGAGGAEQIVFSLAKSLAQNNTDVAVASAGHDAYLYQKLQESNIKVFALNPIDRKSQVREIAKVIRSYHPDVVHSHMFDANLPSVIACLIYRLPLIVTIHSTAYELETWKRRLINALLSRCASQVVAVSNAVADALKNAGVPPKKITCIHNGVDISRYMKQNGANLRQELCIENDGRVVGMVANFRPAKDYELAIRAADIVIKRIPRTHFIFAGDGVDKTAEPILKLQALLGMNGNVFLLGFREDIPNILSTLDLFILASKVEGLPVSVIEAMATGLPVVASNVGGMAELVDEGVTGFLVPPDDCNKFAERIMDILLNFELAKSMGTAGKLKAIKNFSLEAMTKAYYSLYVKLASSRS